MPVVRSIEEIDGHEVEILIEVDQPVSEKLSEVYGKTRDRAKMLERVDSLFESGLSVVRNCAARTVEGMAALEDRHRPDEFQLQLAVNLDGELGARIVKLSSEAQMQVTLTWRHER